MCEKQECSKLNRDFWPLGITNFKLTAPEVKRNQKIASQHRNSDHAQFRALKLMKFQALDWESRSFVIKHT